MKRFGLIVMATAFVGLGSLPCASAAVLYDSISGQSAFSGDSVGPVTPSNQQGPIYSSFTTGSQPLLLSSVELGLSATSPNDGGSVNVNIWSDLNSIVPGFGPGPNAPAGFVGSISDSAIVSSDPTNPTLITLTPSSSILLDPNAMYWVELDSGQTASSSAFWSWQLGSAGIGAGVNYSENAGTAYAVNSNVNLGVTYFVQVSGVPVPEPSALAIFGLGVLGIGLLGQARRHI